MKKAVIFDLDGTLVNSLPDISASMNRALRKAGLPVFSVEAYKYKVGNGVLKIAERSVGERMDKYDQVLADYMADYAVRCRENSYAYEGVTEALQTMISRGLRVCVLSNKDQADTESVLAYYFPDIAFSVVRGRVADVPLKPAPDGALLIAEQLAVKPCECWYVGDTSMDMQCGNAAGMETIGVLWGFRPREELVANRARHLAATPEELIAITTVA